MITDLKINEEKKKEYYEKGYWTHDTIRDVWERQAQANADKEYVADDQGCRMTYGEVDDAASRLAAWLVSQGIKPGDVVTLQFPNWAEFTIAYVACFKAGAVIQSLAHNFNGADLTYAMNLVESRAYIGPTSFHGVDYEQQILDIAGDIPTLKVIALVDKKAPKQTDLPTVAEIVATTEPLAEKVPVESDQVACLLSTSGTTGKRVVAFYTQHDIDLWEDCCARAIVAAGGTNEDVCQVSYGYGLFTGGLGAHAGGEAMGCTVIPTSSGNTKRQVQMLKDCKTDILACTPSYALLIADTAIEMGYDPATEFQISGGIFGAEPCSENMRQEIADKLGIQYCDVYGLSEIMGPGVAMECAERGGLHIAEDQFYCEIIDPETLEVLPDGEVGELARKMDGKTRWALMVPQMV